MSSQLDMIDKYFNELLRTYSKTLQLAKLDSLGVSAEKVDALLQPVKLEKVNTAESRENLGEKLGGWIAYLLVPLCFMGCSYPAIDIAAGEKERGTLETLLICPISRSSLVLLQARRIGLDEVLAELDRREGTSGIEEKASRSE